ncbi:hypothetical protein [Neisseria sp. 83E34]|uniref:hypothetical protein n=1 Tax=Neisseria sp. 83E34 TaxID=1692264 RepID=UPI0006CE6E45|nr:hypothetical protein [Neisseria sp. 83E34]KPN71633.1 hypothetical protein AKG09_04900 [Neisseria sp. 83E34]
MPQYKTSQYLSVVQLYELATDWWQLNPEQHQFVYGFIHDWDAFRSWLDEYSEPFEAYKAGGKARQETIAAYPEHYPLFVYAQWMRLQDGLLLNTLLSRYGYADACSKKGAYEQSADFFELLLAEAGHLNLLPPTGFDAGAEIAALNSYSQEN